MRGVLVGRWRARGGPVRWELNCTTEPVRCIKLKVLAIAHASRDKTASGKEKMKRAYVALLEATGRVVGQAKKFSREIAEGVNRGN